MAERIRLIHWKPAEGEAVAERLRRAGYDVAYDAADSPELLRALRAAPPDAVVIDLARQPSHGRDMALALREYVATRRVPLVLAGGEEAKVAAIRALLPDAVYTQYADLESALAQAIAHPPADPVVPASRLAGYADAPLPRKLGIVAGSRVTLVDAPDGFEELVVPLPTGATFTRSPLVQQGHDHTGGRESTHGRDSTRNIAVWFVRARADLAHIAEMVPYAENGGLWIAWPKQGSALAGDVTQNHVRAAGLAAGLMDYKVCAIDATWSGLRFTHKRVG
jgi:CheY-like chemotaxis protein